MTRARALSVLLIACWCFAVRASDLYDVSFSTYYDGSGFAQVRDICSDAAGNVYVTGGTDSADYPRTVGPALQGWFDAFVTKFDRAGRVVWSRLLGGPEYDRAYGIEIDPAGDIVVSGRAGHGFPVTAGALQTTFQGYDTGSAYGWQNSFVAKLSPDGATVRWATYIGTAQMNRDFDLDPAGNIIIASEYAPPMQAPWPAAWFAGGYQPTPRGGNDDVVAELAADGTRVLWATFLGGSGDESGKNTLRRAPDGSIYLFTNTDSTDIPTPGGFQRTKGAAQDFYLAKLAGDGRSLIWGTYFGGNGTDWCETHHLAVDSASNAYVDGTTDSTDLVTTPGAFRRTYAGAAGTFFHAIGDAVVAKFSPSGALLAATYVGGGGGDNAQGLGVDAAGNVYFTGGTVSDDFPLAGNSYQTARRGSEDFIVCKLAADFATLRYATYVGSSQEDEGRTLCVEPDGTFCVAGQAVGSDWPVRNAVQGTYGGGSGDNIIMRFAPRAAAPVAPAITAQPVAVTVTAGLAATFAVSASGSAPLAYQWQRGGVAIPGATAATYTTPPTTVADSGATFRCVVSNPAGSVTSSGAVLTVRAADGGTTTGGTTTGGTTTGGTTTGGTTTGGTTTGGTTTGGTTTSGSTTGGSTGSTTGGGGSGGGGGCGAGGGLAAAAAAALTLRGRARGR